MGQKQRDLDHCTAIVPTIHRTRYLDNIFAAWELGKRTSFLLPTAALFPWEFPSPSSPPFSLPFDCHCPPPLSPLSLPPSPSEGPVKNHYHYGLSAPLSLPLSSLPSTHYSSFSNFEWDIEERASESASANRTFSLSLSLPLRWHGLSKGF